LYRITAQMRVFPSAAAGKRGGAAFAIHRETMTHRSRILLVLTITVSITASTVVSASEPAAAFPRVRTIEPPLRALIDDAIRSSATVRALVERITASDVVVFVECERNPAVSAAGRLNFIVTAGGQRYVVIRLKPKGRAVAIAMLAHELQHAAEIADAPAIVDEESLAREYARIGYRSHTTHGIAFDTRAAVDVGRRVIAELIAE
jgi:hypothetical protein